MSDFWTSKWWILIDIYLFFSFSGHLREAWVEGSVGWSIFYVLMLALIVWSMSVNYQKFREDV